MISDKIKKKVDKQWAASKAIVFDWKTAPDEEAAYMMYLYLKDMDKEEHDPENLLKWIKILRYGKLSVPKYNVGPNLREYVYHQTVHGKLFKLQMKLHLEYGGEQYPMVSAPFLHSHMADYGFNTYTATDTFKKVSLLQHEAREIERKALVDLAKTDGPALIEAYAAKARPATKVNRKVVNNLIRVIRKAYPDPANRNVEMIASLVWVIKTGWGPESTLQEFLTSLRRNRESLNALTPEIWSEIANLLEIEGIHES